MAIETYKLASGAVRYRATAYMDNHRKVSKRGFRTKKEAKKWIAETQVLGAPKKKSQLTYGEVVDKWLEEYKPTVRPSTYLTAEQEVKSSYHVIPPNALIRTITASDINELAQYLSATFSTIKMRMSRVKAVFRYAVEENIIEENPCDKLKMPKQKKKSKTYQTWTRENLLDFLSACQEDNNMMAYPLFRLLAFTGIRAGELTALKWSDLNGNMLSINRTMTLDYDYHYIMGDETKTESSKRVIALDAETLAVLEDWRTFCPSKEKIFPVLPSRIPEWMHRIIAKCPNVPDSTPHKLRHLHVSILLDANANIKDVQERLGHASARTTLDVYADANPNKSVVADIFTNALNETRR